MGDSSYKGVSAARDSRFTNKQTVLLRKLKFPPHFDVKVDMRKVELSVMKPWIARRITELLGFEDDVVLEYASGMLEEDRFPDPKKVQIQLMGFLEGKTAEFMSELWELLISAQDSPGGVPKRFVEEKKEELRLKREEGERVVREARERAQRAAEAAGDSTGRKRSRWDAAPPTTSSASNGDTRPPAYGAGRNNDDFRRRETRDDPTRSEWNRRRNPSFRDRSGNTTDRSRDSGWGARAPHQGDSYRPSTRRSPSPPPLPSRRDRRRSPSPVIPPPRESRSRSRSVTPDYREKIRKERPSRREVVEEDAYDRDARRTHRREEKDKDSYGRDRERRRDHRSARRDEEQVEDAYERDARRAAPRDEDGSDDESKVNHHKQKRSRRDEDDQDAKKEEEKQREKELRDKLMRAKSSKGSRR
ncbi:uncharacterized protein UTRI_02123_B [Ustilago trichophora]|uniref:PWI domain-containing protein n=1 Tax=Ustilago trichophora TaxID=86804 RepID=A0A5C3DV47_9BASI|nr:uncharacterized protein UTRI_02123_B [Ustilago trichophora]